MKLSKGIQFFAGSTQTTYDLTNLNLSAGNYAITVVAEAEGFTDSDVSNSVNYTVQAQLAAPTTVNLTGKVLTWNNVANNSGYEILYRRTDGSGEIYQTDMVDANVTQHTLTVTTAGTYSVTIVTLGTGSYTDSAESAAVTYTVLPQLATPTIAMNADGKTLEITDVADATSYDVYVDGTLKTNVQRVTGYTVTFASNFSGEAYGGGELSSVTLTANTGASTPLTSAARGLVWQGVSTLAASRGVANGIGYTDANGVSQSFGQYLTLTSDITITYANDWCLTGDMLITLADGSTKRIDTITLADKVLAYNPETMALEADEIIRCDSDEIKTHSEYDVWTFDDGTIIKTVHRHRFYNVERNAMVYMDEWNVGDHAIKIDGTKVALVNHANVQEEVRHYTIFTKNQNYFANGLLSGNRYTKPIIFANDGR